MAEHMVQAILQSAVFSLLGVIIFALAFFVLAKVLPFSLRKEIEEDQNTALGIVLGSVILGLALIVSAAIKG